MNKIQRVDPFIPVPPRLRHKPKPHVRQPDVNPRAALPAGTVEGFVRPRTMQPYLRTPVVPAASANSVPANPPMAPVSPPYPPKARRTWLRRRLKTAGLIMVILLAGVLVQALLLGELLIAAYAVYALIRRVASRTTFILALISLGTILVLRLLGKDTLLAANFAVYSLLLAFVGIVSLAREVRQSRP